MRQEDIKHIEEYLGEELFESLWNDLLVKIDEEEGALDMSALEVMELVVEYIKRFSHNSQKVNGFEEKCICDWSKDDEYGFIPNTKCPVHGNKTKELLKETVEFTDNTKNTKGCGCDIGCASCGDFGVDNLCNEIQVFCSECASKTQKVKK